MSASWYIRRGNATSGPFSSADIKRLGIDGELLHTDELSKDQKKWVSATKVAGLVHQSATVGAEAAATWDDDASRPAESLAGPTQARSSAAEEPKVRMTRSIFFFTSFFGSVGVFVFLWLLLLMNIWPFAVGWSWTDGKDPSQSVFGKLAKTISGIALSPYSLYALGGIAAIGLLVGCFATLPMITVNPTQHRRAGAGARRRRRLGK